MERTYTYCPLARVRREPAAELRRLLRENPGHAGVRLLLAEALLAGPDADQGAREALDLLADLDRAYGAGDGIRLRALLLLGRRDDARLLAAESFFLAAEDRARVP